MGHSIADVLSLIGEATGYSTPTLIHQPDFSTDVGKNILSTERIKLEAGWMPNVMIEQGIEDLGKGI